MHEVVDVESAGEIEQRYLRLLKKTLAFELWEEPGMPLERIAYGGPALRGLAGALARLLRLARLGLVYRGREGDPRSGSVWPGNAHTMIGARRLDNLHACVERVLRDGIPGDLIETGVWRGGACILMRGILAAHGVRDRRVFVADSFCGLPKPDGARYPADRGDRHHRIGLLQVSREEVEANFRSYDLLDDQVIFLEGWFEDTLPTAPIERLAVLRLDGDMYQSTMDVLEPLYPKLAPGGFCIIDDYALPGCRRAVDDYRARHAVDEPIEEIDWTGAFWRKR